MYQHRLAWFTPFPPIRSRISSYSKEILPTLLEKFEIDVYIDNDMMPKIPSAGSQASSSISTYSAYDFIWRHQKKPYELTVYQLGNHPRHDYMWAYLTQFPGLVVLHDDQLHYSRAQQLLRSKKSDAHYRQEFAYCHPQAREEVSNFLTKYLMTVGFGDAMYRLWPLLRVVLNSAHLVAVHNRRFADNLRDQYPHKKIEYLQIGTQDLISKPPSSTMQTRSCRIQHGIASDALVFGMFGLVTQEKRVIQTLNALPGVIRDFPGTKLLLVGESTQDFDVMKEIHERNLADHVVVTGFVPDDQVPDYIQTMDVCLCMRWPSFHEPSSSWLQCLSASKATIITDLAHNIDIPALDPRTWRPQLETVITSHEIQPICVSIDLTDEEHSLRLAMWRLASDRKLRMQLGQRARNYWEKHHRLEYMTADYVRVLKQGFNQRPVQFEQLPSHLRSDGTELVRELLNEMDTTVDILKSDSKNEHFQP